MVKIAETSCNVWLYMMAIIFNIENSVLTGFILIHVFVSSVVYSFIQLRAVLTIRAPNIVLYLLFYFILFYLLFILWVNVLKLFLIMWEHTRIVGSKCSNLCCATNCGLCPQFVPPISSIIVLFYIILFISFTFISWANVLKLFILYEGAGAHLGHNLFFYFILFYCFVLFYFILFYLWGYFLKLLLMSCVVMKVNVIYIPIYIYIVHLILCYVSLCENL